MPSVPKEQIESAKSYSMLSMLEQLGIQITRDNKISCPFHSEKTPSASVGKKNILTCWACGTRNVDNIGLYMQIMGTDFPTAVAEINKLAGMGFVSNGKRIAATNRSREIKDPIESYREFLCFFKPYRTLNTSKKAIVNKYLEDRCLNGSVDILHLQGMDIGLDSYNHICWHLRTFGIVVYSDNKINKGSPCPILIQNKEASSDIWAITEGITDALSAYKMGYNAICLNSVNNVPVFLKMLSAKSSSKKFTYIIAVDWDKAGIRAMNILVTFFKENGYKYDFIDGLYDSWDSKVKDLNELYVLNCRNN